MTLINSAKYIMINDRSLQDFVTWFLVPPSLQVLVNLNFVWWIIHHLCITSIFGHTYEYTRRYHENSQVKVILSCLLIV